MWLTLWGGRGRGGDVLKVEGLMMMPVRKLSALTSPAGCFPKHISALHLPHALASSGRPGQSSASWSGVVGSNFFLKMRILRMRDEVFAIGLKRALMEQILETLSLLYSACSATQKYKCAVINSGIMQQVCSNLSFLYMYEILLHWILQTCVKQSREYGECVLYNVFVYIVPDLNLSHKSIVIPLWIVAENKGGTQIRVCIKHIEFSVQGMVMYHNIFCDILNSYKIKQHCKHCHDLNAVFI